MPDDDDTLDGCALDFQEALIADEDVDTVVMFADVWDAPEAVEVRRIELIEWDLARREVEDV